MDRTFSKSVGCYAEFGPLADPGGGGNPAMSPKAQEGGTSCHLAPQKVPKNFRFCFILFSKMNLGSYKNSGLNPWSFQFWGYPRLGPRPKLAPLKPAAGSASDLAQVAGVELMLPPHPSRPPVYHSVSGRTREAPKLTQRQLKLPLPGL